jgi:putative membrane-bound dehydrogenase-like protein
MIAMIVPALGLLLTISCARAPAASAPARPLDSRLVLERIAAEPQIVTPTGIAVDGRGRVLVIESHTHFRPEGYKGPPADRIRVFEDQDGDGKPECVGSFFEGTRMTMSVAVARDGSVFVATRSALYRLSDRDGDGRADGALPGTIPTPIVRLDTPGDYPHNGLSGFAFDFADNVVFGLGENLGADYRLKGSDGTTLAGGGEGGNIYRCRPDGSQLERVATGFWNPFHLTYDAYGRLFAVDNDPDSRPPCRLLHIVEGGDYGYRFRNGRKGLHPFTAWNGELPGTLGMVAGTGEAPSGVLEYQGNNLPQDYVGTLLVTSWGDHRIEQFRLEPRGASFRARMKPVVAGGEDFRPVGIASAPDGSLYVSDWVDKSYTLHGQGRIWRLRSAAAIHDGARTRPETSPRPAALAAAGLEGRIDDTSVASFLHSDLTDLRALGVSILPASRIDLKAIAGSDASPLVRAAALRRMTDPSAKEALLKALESDDSFLQQAARRGLRRSLQTSELVAIAGQQGLTPAQRLGILLVLRDDDRPEARTRLPVFLADHDASIRFAAIQWVGEHRIEPFRRQLLLSLASSTATRSEFEAALAALERLDGKRRDPTDEFAGEDYIVALLRHPQTSAAVLQRGLRMLRPDHPALSLDRLRRFLTRPEEAVRLEAVRTMCQSPLSGRFEILAKLAEDQSAASSLRAAAIDGLADDADRQRDRLLALARSARPVVRHEAIRDLRGIMLTKEERAMLRASSRGDDAALELLDLLESRGNAAGSGTRPSQSVTTNVDAWLARLEGPAEESAGDRVFFHAKGPGCFRCHQVNGRGSRVGPDLSKLADGLDRRRLVESIVAPSKEIAPQFVTWSVARTDGTVFTGILLEQSPEGAQVYADSAGRSIVDKPDELAERKPLTISIMPEDLAQTMTIQDFRDLLAFLWRNR